MSYTKRDSKDPMPTAANTARQGGGNEPYPAGAETHGKVGSSKVGSDVNRTTGAVANAVQQPTRQGGGNTPVTGESHDQKKARTVPESARW